MSKLCQMPKMYGLFLLNDREKQQIFTKKKKENYDNKRIKVKICSSKSPNNLRSPLFFLWLLFLIILCSNNLTYTLRVD